MNIISNDALIRRMNLIAQAAMIGGMLVLGAGLYVSFTQAAKYYNLSLVALLLGFILSQVGIYFSNRYGRRPRPDELLNQGLKGLDGKYTLYHYLTPTPHLLVGPAGIWILMPRPQKGKISFVNGRWKHQGGNLYLKLFAQESLGRPDLEAASEKEKLTRELNKKLPGVNLPEIQAVLVFSNPRTVIDIPEDAETPAVAILLSDLKEFIRKQGKSSPLSAMMITQVTDVFPRESR